MELLKEDAIAALERIMCRIEASLVADPKGEHDSLAMDWLDSFGRCLVTGCDIIPYGYPRAMWATRGLNYAHKRMQIVILQADSLAMVLADDKTSDKKGGFAAFATSLEHAFRNRVRAWYIEVAGKYSFGATLKNREHETKIALLQKDSETDLLNHALSLGLGIFRKDCRVLDRAFFRHRELLIHVNCGNLPQPVRESVSLEFKGTVPWWLAGGLESDAPFNPIRQAKFQELVGQDEVQEA